MPGMSRSLADTVRYAVQRTFEGAVCKDSPHNVLTLSLPGASDPEQRRANIARLREPLTLALNYPLVVALMSDEEGLKKTSLPNQYCAKYRYQCSAGTVDNALVVARLSAAGAAESFAVIGRCKDGAVVIDTAEARRSRCPTQVMVGMLEHDTPQGPSIDRYYETLAQQKSIRDLAERMITAGADGRPALMVPQFRDVPQVVDRRPAKFHEGWIVRYVLIWDLDLPDSVLADISKGLRPLTLSAPAKVYDSIKCVKLALEQHYADSRQTSPKMTQRELLRSVPPVWELCQLGVQMARHMPGAVVHTSGNKGVHVKVRDAAGFVKVHTDEYKGDFGKKLTDFGSDYLLARAPSLRAAAEGLTYRPQETPDRAIHSRHGGIALRSGGARKSSGVLPTLLDDEGLDSPAFSDGDPVADATALQRLRAADRDFFAWMVNNAPCLADAAPPTFGTDAATLATRAAKKRKQNVANTARLAGVWRRWENRFSLAPESKSSKGGDEVKKALRLSVQTPQYRNSEYVADPQKMDRILRFAASNYLWALHSAGRTTCGRPKGPPPELHNVPLNERYRRYDGAAMRFAIDVDDVELDSEHLRRIARIVDRLVQGAESLRPCTVMMVLQSTACPGKMHLVWPGVVLPQTHLAPFAQQVQQDCNADRAFPVGIAKLVDAAIYNCYLRLYCSPKPDRAGGDLLPGCYVLRRVFAPSDRSQIGELRDAFRTLELLSGDDEWPGPKKELVLSDALLQRCAEEQAVGSSALAEAFVTLHRYCALTPCASGQLPTMLPSLLEQETERQKREERQLQQIVSSALYPHGGMEQVRLPANLFRGSKAVFAAAAAAALLCKSVLATDDQKALLAQTGALVARQPKTDKDGNVSYIVAPPKEWVTCNIKGGDHTDGSSIFCCVWSRPAGVGASPAVEWFVSQKCLNSACAAQGWEMLRVKAPRHLCLPAQEPPQKRKRSVS